MVFILDQASKAAVLRFLAPGESRAVAGGLFRLTHHSNPGAAFGAFGDLPRLLLVLSIAFTAALALYLAAERRPESPLRMPLLLVLGGAAGNTLDRIRTGRVMDFIDVGFWPVFNAADSAITIGALWIVWRLWRDRKRPGRRDGTP